MTNEKNASATTRKEGNNMVINKTPPPKRVKVTAKPKVYPGGLLLTKGSIAEALSNMDDELANEIVAVGKEYDDATQIEGNWYNKPTRKLPAIVLECSDDFANHIHEYRSRFEGYIADEPHVTDSSDERALMITWDEDQPKRLLAYGLSVRKKLSDLLDRWSFDTIGDDREERKSWSYALGDIHYILEESEREQGYYSSVNPDKVDELRDYWRHPEFHKEDLKELEDLVEQHPYY